MDLPDLTRVVSDLGGAILEVDMGRIPEIPVLEVK